MDDIGRYVIEEVTTLITIQEVIPIVRDNEDGAGVAEEIVCQVCNTRNVQHVARF
jgi:hypothetical protein